MAHNSSRLLEFDSLRALISGCASSALGRQRILELQPCGDVGWIVEQQEMTEEIRAFRRAGGSFDFAGMQDPSQPVSKARISGAVLDPHEIKDVILLVDRAAEWKSIAQTPSANMRRPWPRIESLSARLENFVEWLRFFRDKIRPDGTLEDRASPELSRIRREMDKQRRTIQESLRGYLRTLAAGGTVQDELVTIRGERFVIPVKVEQKRRVQGVVHGASSSGQTVYIEPLETIEQNNELVRLQDEELAEVHRILLDMTRRIGERADAILVAVDVLGSLELQFAKARFAEDYDCVAVSFRNPDTAVLFLRDARHPLLERSLTSKGARAVPVSVELDAEHHQLVITGPNTGGKTVTLKTLGLLVLMAQAGIPVPATKAEMSPFDAVLADIGDYQSIEQNLSTFSAHVTNIDFISRTATRHSLVLLDELGSATDPEEGAVLAVAIAAYFGRIGAISAISTHHTSMKVYGASASGVVNASMGFDEATLQPTYKLKTGVPGASAGINIAQRLGLNPEIIAAARASLGTQSRDIGEFLDQLHSRLRQVEAEQLRLSELQQELDRARLQLASEGKKEQQASMREMERKLETLFRDFEYHAREAVSAIQDRAAGQKVSKEAERRIAKMRREFREQFDASVVAHSTGADRGDPNAQPQLVQHVQEGDTVKLKSTGRPARVLRRVSADQFEMEVGSMKMRVAREDIAEVLSRAADSPVAAARARGINVSLEKETGGVKGEINVIGQTVDDATREVERFVDRAFLAGMPQVRIVHGSGMGILRKALRQALQQHPHVDSVVEPPQAEGGAGATVVGLKI
jgi:DNA mismatch repair protein MutS2